MERPAGGCQQRGRRADAEAGDAGLSLPTPAPVPWALDATQAFLVTMTAYRQPMSTTLTLSGSHGLINLQALLLCFLSAAPMPSSTP